MTAFSATAAPGLSTRAAAATNGNRWAWLGVAIFVMGMFVTWSMQLSVPQDEANIGGPAFVDALDTTGREILWRVTSGLGFVAAGALVFFGAQLKRKLELRDPSSTIPGITFGAFLITAAGVALASSFRAQFFDTLNLYDADPSAHVTIARIAQDAILTSWVTLGVATAAFAYSGLRGALVPRGLGWFSAIMTGLIVVLCMVGGAFPAHIPAMLWLLVTSIWCLRSSDEPASA
jgi:hypothetical protein